jgi:3-oxoacyl-[acyl-carrier protein] reductase
MDIDLSGRRALITGGSLGLGRAMAEMLAGAGASVAVVARRPEVLAEAKEAVEAKAAKGAKVATVVADVASAGGCEAAFAEAESALGGVDILINNAGSSKRGAFEELTDVDWQADFDLKVFANVRLCRLALPGMKQRRWGRIINTLNTAAKAPPAEGAPTAVSRAAGLSITKILAGEAAAHGVTVNALLVGKIESDQWVRRAEREGRTLADVMSETGATIPMGRMGKSSEFAAVACFLCSDHAAYVTGTAINVDGGLCPIV